MKARIVAALGTVACLVILGGCGAQTSAQPTQAPATKQATPQVSPDPSPTPSPLGLTAGEKKYIAKVKDWHSGIKDSLHIIGEEAPKWPWSDESMMLLAAAFGGMQQAHDDFKNVAAPSDRFAGFHALWEQELGTYNKAANLYISGADNQNAGDVKKANGLILKAAVMDYKSMKLLHRLEAQYQ